MERCEACGVMLLPIRRDQTRALSTVKPTTKWDVADAIAGWFPEIADRLPHRRKPWETEDERIGLFMALAAAVAAWESFRGSR